MISTIGLCCAQLAPHRIGPSTTTSTSDDRAAAEDVIFARNIGDMYAAANVAACQGDCTAEIDNFLSQFMASNHTIYDLAQMMTYAVPALLGVFWGAPLIARELEAGTHRLVWNQSVTRTRWLATKLAIVGGAAALTAGLLSWAVTTSSNRIDDATGDRITPLLYGARGIVPIGYAIFAFTLGVTLGMLIRRTSPRWQPPSPSTAFRIFAAGMDPRTPGIRQPRHQPARPFITTNSSTTPPTTSGPSNGPRPASSSPPPSCSPGSASGGPPTPHLNGGQQGKSAIDRAMLDRAKAEITDEMAEQKTGLATPRQAPATRPPSTMLGVELAATGLLGGGLLLRLNRPSKRAEQETWGVWLFGSYVPSILIALLAALGGITLIAERGGGLYWVAPAVVIALLTGLAGAWVMLVEILR